MIVQGVHHQVGRPASRCPCTLLRKLTNSTKRGAVDGRLGRDSKGLGTGQRAPWEARHITDQRVFAPQARPRTPGKPRHVAAQTLRLYVPAMKFVLHRSPMRLPCLRVPCGSRGADEIVLSSYIVLRSKIICMIGTYLDMQFAALCTIQSRTHAPQEDEISLYPYPSVRKKFDFPMHWRSAIARPSCAH